MPDTLSTFTQAMALLPDNTSRLVSPDDQRSVAISLLPDRGAAFADSAAGPWVIPITTAGVWVDIPLSISADMVASPASLFWRMNANGGLFYNYAADWPTIVVPPGYTRAVRTLGILSFDPLGSIVWQFAVGINGVAQEPFESVETAAQTDAVTVTVVGSDGIDVSLAPVVSIMVRNQTNTDDLPLTAFAYSTQGGVLA